jgi:hypothetical protein
MLKCKCNNELIYEDNSIKTEDGRYGEVYPLYYCNKCNKLYDAWELDCEGKYIEVLDEKYFKWFN